MSQIPAEIMEACLEASPVFHSTEFLIGGNHGKTHFTASSFDYGEALLGLVHPDCQSFGFYYSESESYLTGIVNLGPSQSSEDIEKTIEAALADIASRYRWTEIRTLALDENSGFSMGRFQVTPDRLKEAFTELLEDIGYVLKAIMAK